MKETDGVLLIVQYRMSTAQPKWREYDRAASYTGARRLADEADGAGYAAVRIVDLATGKVIER